MASAYKLIANYTVPSDTSSYTFSGIAATYKHLVLRCNDKSTRSDYGFDSVCVQVNGLTSGYTNWRGYTDNVSASPQTDSPAGGSATLSFTNSSTTGNVANAYGASELYFYDYTNTGKYKAMMGWGGANNQGTGIYCGIGVCASYNTLTSAINSIKIFMGSGGNIVAGSIYSLYGITNV